MEAQAKTSGVTEPRQTSASIDLLAKIHRRHIESVLADAHLPPWPELMQVVPNGILRTASLWGDQAPQAPVYGARMGVFAGTATVTAASHADARLHCNSDRSEGASIHKEHGLKTSIRIRQHTPASTMLLLIVCSIIVIDRKQLRAHQLFRRCPDPPAHPCVRRLPITFARFANCTDCHKRLWPTRASFTEPTSVPWRGRNVTFL